MLAAALCATAAAGSAPSAAAGQPPEAPRLEFSDSVEVHWILVPAFVEPPASAGLPQAAFKLWVNGRPVPIETFENRPEAAASVVVLQDLSGSMHNAQKLVHSRLVLDRLLAGASAEDEFSLVTFTDRHTQVALPFTSDLAAVRERAAGFVAEGSTALYDAITWLPRLSLEGRRSRRAGVVLTDGVDNASLLDARGSMEYVARTELPIYVIDLSDLGASRPSADDGRTAALRELCRGTGGRYQRPVSPAELTRAANLVAAELRNQYVLGFGADASQPSSAHSLRVEVASAAGTVVRHRPSYFGPPPLVSGPPAAGAGDYNGDVKSRTDRRERTP